MDSHAKTTANRSSGLFGNTAALRPMRTLQTKRVKRKNPLKRARRKIGSKNKLDNQERHGAHGAHGANEDPEARMNTETKNASVYPAAPMARCGQKKKSRKKKRRPLQTAIDSPPVISVPECVVPFSSFDEKVERLLDEHAETPLPGIQGTPKREMLWAYILMQWTRPKYNELKSPIMPCAPGWLKNESQETQAKYIELNERVHSLTKEAQAAFQTMSTSVQSDPNSLAVLYPAHSSASTEGNSVPESACVIIVHPKSSRFASVVVSVLLALTHDRRGVEGLRCTRGPDGRLSVCGSLQPGKGETAPTALNHFMEAMRVLAVAHRTCMDVPAFTNPVALALQSSKLVESLNIAQTLDSLYKEEAGPSLDDPEEWQFQLNHAETLPGEVVVLAATAFMQHVVNTKMQPVCDVVVFSQATGSVLETVRTSLRRTPVVPNGQWREWWAVLARISERQRLSRHSSVDVWNLTRPVGAPSKSTAATAPVTIAPGVAVQLQEDLQSKGFGCVRVPWGEAGYDVKENLKRSCEAAGKVGEWNVYYKTAGKKAGKPSKLHSVALSDPLQVLPCDGDVARKPATTGMLFNSQCRCGAAVGSNTMDVAVQEAVLRPLQAVRAVEEAIQPLQAVQHKFRGAATTPSNSVPLVPVLMYSKVGKGKKTRMHMRVSYDAWPLVGTFLSVSDASQTLVQEPVQAPPKETEVPPTPTKKRQRRATKDTKRARPKYKDHNRTPLEDVPPRSSNTEIEQKQATTKMADMLISSISSAYEKNMRENVQKEVVKQLVKAYGARIVDAISCSDVTREFVTFYKEELLGLFNPHLAQESVHGDDCDYSEASD